MPLNSSVGMCMNNQIVLLECMSLQIVPFKMSAARMSVIRKNEVGLVWFSLVLWHINPCWLFNAKSCFYIYIKYMIHKHIL